MPGEIMDDGRLDGAHTGHGQRDAEAPLEQPQGAHVDQGPDPGHHLELDHSSDMNGRYTHKRLFCLCHPGLPQRASGAKCIAAVG